VYRRLVAATIPCESCGREEAAVDVVPVHRVYITPPARGFEDLTEPKVQVVEDLERWCASCRGTYPHQLEGDDEPLL
jgi:hypothetical protein